MTDWNSESAVILFREARLLMVSDATLVGDGGIKRLCLMACGGLSLEAWLNCHRIRAAHWNLTPTVRVRTGTGPARGLRNASYVWMDALVAGMHWLL